MRIEALANHFRWRKQGGLDAIPRLDPSLRWVDVCLTLRADPFRTGVFFHYGRLEALLLTTACPSLCVLSHRNSNSQIWHWKETAGSVPTTSKGSSYLCGKIDLAVDVAGGAHRRVPNLDIASLHHHDCKALSQLTLPFLEHCVFPSVFGVKISLPLVIGIPKIFLQLW